MRTTVEIDIEYSECHTEYGLVRLACPADDLSGLRIAVFPDEYLPDGCTDFESTGRHQVHISGTPKALQELGRFLVAISELAPLPREFVTHIDPISGGANERATHLIVHQNFTDCPKQIRRVGELIDADDEAD